MSVTSIAIKFTAIDLMSQAVNSVKSRLSSLASASKDTQKHFDQMTKSFKYGAFAAIGTKAMANAIKPAVDFAGDLQSEMLGVEAELAGGVKSAWELQTALAQIKKTAFDVQAWTPFDETQVVALEKELLKAGAKMQDIAAKNGATVAAAALATYEENLGAVDAGKALIGIGTPFKIAADGYLDLADKISRASSASTTGAREIVDTAKYAAPAMAALNRPIDEMMIMSAMLANSGIEASMSGTALRQFYNSAAKLKNLRDANGELKSLTEITAILKENFGQLGSAERQAKFTELFDVRGAVVALALMESEGANTYEAVAKAMEEALPLQEKINVRMRGFNKQWEALKGTSKSTIAELYQPALAPLTSIVAKTNEWVTALGQVAQRKSSVAEFVSKSSFAGLGVGALATLGFGGAGLYSLRKVLQGVGGVKGLFKGASGTAAGIAQGKAIEAATGVQSVFVVNWPDGFRGSATDKILDKAGAGSILAKIEGSAKKVLGMIAGSGLAKPLAVAGGGLALGYGIGTVIDEFTGLTDMLAKKIADTPELVQPSEKVIAKILAANPDRSKIEITNNIRIDKHGRIISETNNPNVYQNNTLDTGSFFD